LAVAEKEFQQDRKDKQTLVRYIDTKRKKEDAQNKAEEEADKKVYSIYLLLMYFDAVNIC
jgi:hypothetical protein